MSVINLTPHAIRVGGQTIAPSGQVARVDNVTDGSCCHIMVGGESIPVQGQRPGETVDLPEEEELVWLVVSAMVRLAHPERHDLLSPGELERDAGGRITGCLGFFCNP